MPFVMLLRHAENDYVKKGRLAGRLPGVHLNKKGLEQAQATAQKLKEAPIKAIYSSPLERALETAVPLAQLHGLEVIPRQGLLETDYGDWQDQKLSSLRRHKIWRVVQGAPSRMQFPGGETFAQVQQRICQEIDSLCAIHEDKDLFVCVSHADPIKLAVAFYIGQPLDMFQRLQISPASVTLLSLGDMGSRLIMMNYESSFNFARK